MSRSNEEKGSLRHNAETRIPFALHSGARGRSVRVARLLRVEIIRVEMIAGRAE